MTLRILIADDELLARKRLHRLLAELDGVEVVGEATDGLEVLQRVASGAIDLVLLDIHMPHLTGMQALKLLPDDVSVVFCTAYAEHAVEAFEHQVVDYLLKPIGSERLAKAVERVREQREPTPTASNEGNGAERRLAVQTRKGVLLLDPSEITHAVIEGATVELHSDRGVLFSDLRLADLERKLPCPPFERLHRRCLVNLDRVVRLEPLDSGGYLAHTDLGVAVDVSRQSARRLRKRFGIS